MSTTALHRYKFISTTIEVPNSLYTTHTQYIIVCFVSMPEQRRFHSHAEMNIIAQYILLPSIKANIKVSTYNNNTLHC